MSASRPSQAVWTPFSRAISRAACRREFRIAFVRQQVFELLRHAFRPILSPRNHAPCAQPPHPRSIVRLIVAVGHHDHRAPRAQGLRRCPHAALVNRSGRARQQFRIRCVLGHKDVVRHWPRWLVPWILADQQHSPASGFPAPPTGFRCRTCPHRTRRSTRA